MSAHLSLTKFHTGSFTLFTEQMEPPDNVMSAIIDNAKTVLLRNVLQLLEKITNWNEEMKHKEFEILSPPTFHYREI